MDIAFQSRLLPDVSGRFSLVYAGYTTKFDEAAPDAFRWPNLDRNGTELEDRGCCFQETKLSVCRLTFGRSMMYWECSYLRCENGLAEPRFLVPTQQAAVLKFDGDEQDWSNLDSSPPKHGARHRFWLIMVQEYGHRNLTYATDRLPALSGMAMAMAEVMSYTSKDRYLAGLWEEYLPPSLVQKRTRPFSYYIVPTWSPLSS